MKKEFERLPRNVVPNFYHLDIAPSFETFKEGMKLEAVDPAAPISIRPATVTKVTDFLIKSVSPTLLGFSPVCCLPSLVIFLSSLPNCLSQGHS